MPGEGLAERIPEIASQSALAMTMSYWTTKGANATKKDARRGVCHGNDSPPMLGNDQDSNATLAMTKNRRGVIISSLEISIEPGVF
jgi:hypothetical protein